ncbi:Tat pathway signal protein [Flavonifractor plautii]|nr:hypothetical protein [Flavonifractor plautii]ERI69332.1 hypothetical protein HMPREF0239_03509 [Clostridium sp. ATCC BAA-442]MDB7900377.1 Tat pathway signal protein [Flavonifractor plautii]MDY3699480.1 Tat pathway signal protein [Flavonifractor plautii]HJF00896.1 Tat pathway signal protein [Flavonifractor plautii]
MDASKEKHMPIIIGIFCALPFLAGLIAEYLVCRLTRRRWWKLLPPAAVVALTAAVAVGRAGVWESDQSPLTQLLFVPGLPALFALLGLLAGWRLWKRLWGPRVVKDKGAR